MITNYTETNLIDRKTLQFNLNNELEIEKDVFNDDKINNRYWITNTSGNGYHQELYEKTNIFFIETIETELFHYYRKEKIKTIIKK